jgi:uncharacterized protein YndB with AHSA1/START domain
MIDLITELDAIRRRTHAPGEDLAVRLERRYPADVEDVWDALTDPERIARWFLPVTGDLRAGGRFATEGNADGEIRECERPSRLVLTWGGPDSVVTLQLTPDGSDATVLVLEHTVPSSFVPDATGGLYVGPGWDGALLGLGIYLSGNAVGDPVAAANSPEVLEFNAGSIQRWEVAVRESGLATEEQIAASVAVATQQYTTLPENAS